MLLLDGSGLRPFAICVVRIYYLRLERTASQFFLALLVKWVKRVKWAKWVKRVKRVTVAGLMLTHFSEFPFREKW
jgi:hypothetical protein